MGTFRDLRPEHDAVEIVVAGVADGGSSAQEMQEAIAFMASLGVWRCLCDFSHASQTASVKDAISAAEALVAATPPEWRQAIFPPRDPSSRMAMDTWEAACNNRGRAVKQFRHEDRGAALAWLAGDPEPSSDAAET